MKALHRALLVLSLVTAALAAVVAQDSAKPMTNADVVKLVKAGLDESVIVAAVQKASKRDFDKSPDALIALTQAGVSPVVIKAMISDANTSTNPASTNSSALDGSGRVPGLYFDRTSEGDLVAMQPTIITQMKTQGTFASGMTYGLKKAHMQAVVGGAQAHLRTTTTLPVFYFHFDTRTGTFGSAFGSWLGAATNPEEFVMIEMTPDRKNNERHFDVGEVGAFGAKTGVLSKDRVEFTAEQVGPGIFRVKTVPRLNRGEFCFFYAQGAAALGGGVTGKLFDFGID